MVVTAEQDAADCDLYKIRNLEVDYFVDLVATGLLFLAIPFPSLGLVLTMFWLMGASWNRIFLQRR